MSPPVAEAIHARTGEAVIGIDVGTTATKAVVYKVGSGRVHTALREYPLLAPEHGWQVQDPAAIRAAVLDTLAECAAALDGAALAGIGVSAALHGLIGLDSDGSPLTPLVTWADGRSVTEARELRTSGLAASIHRASGTPVHPMTPLTKLMWFSRHEPELAARARWWAGLKDYVLAILTATVATELSSASGTAMLDLATKDWSPHAVELTGVRADQLPPVLSTTTALPLAPAAAERVGLPAGLPVVVGAGDGPLGNVGTGAMEPGVVGLSLGTSGAVRMAVPRPAIDPAGRLFCYALTDDLWIVGGAISTGGVAVRWARDVFGCELVGSSQPDADLLALAEQVPPGSNGLLMLPYLLAERAPLWDPDLTGAYLGIRLGHTRQHFVRATVEGVALQLSTIVDALDEIEPVREVRATGGAFRSALWRRVVAGVIGRPVTVTAGAEGSALGVAALALVALGRAGTLDEGVRMLGAADQSSSSEPAEVASPAEVAFYRDLRSTVPTLLAAYDDVARLFAGEMSGRAAEREKTGER